MKKPRTRNTVILPISLVPEELEQIRSALPEKQRSRIILDLLKREGYLQPKTGKSSEAA